MGGAQYLKFHPRRIEVEVEGWLCVGLRGLEGMGVGVGERGGRVILVYYDFFVNIYDSPHPFLSSQPFLHKDDVRAPISVGRGTENQI